MKVLSSNQDLYDYMLFLESELQRRGLASLSKAVAFAIGAASSLSTEFLGESRIALRHVLKGEKGALNKQERSDLIDVLKQLDQALDAQR